VRTISALGQPPTSVCGNSFPKNAGTMNTYVHFLDYSKTIPNFLKYSQIHEEKKIFFQCVLTEKGSTFPVHNFL